MKIRSFRPKTHKKNSVDNNSPVVAAPSPSRHTPPIKVPPTISNLPPANHTLRLIPLGGVGDVTKNMYVYEYGDDIVIIDCGVGFPDEGMLGVDLVIPDITYLKDKISKIRGILITHAHDDHIGGLPYLWPQLNVPIYTQKLTAGMIKAKFTEHRLPKDQIKTVSLKDKLHLGSFEVSFYQVSHSVPDSTGIILKTPIGTLIHQADFKMDWTPVNGQVTDVGTVARAGDEGVLLMTIDCLRVEKQGYTLSEKTIEPTFAKVEMETKGKVLITMTSSNITRVQQAINVAQNSGRKLALSGRSVESNFQVARDLGYLDVPAGLVIAQEEIKRFPDQKLLILVAGSQGQPGSALSRAANNDHKYIQLGKDDSVIFSADPIPSTETAQSALIDTLTKLGCDVYYSAMLSDLHVSGHAAAEELKVMINLAKPKYILPIGGNYRHMKSFARMAYDMGYGEDQIFLTRDGQTIQISKNKAWVDGRLELSNIYVDGLGVGDIGSIVLRDRQVMSEEGIVMVVVPVDQKTGHVVGEPDIISRGFVFEQHAEDLIEAGKEIVRSVLDDKPDTPLDWRYTRHQIEEHLEKFFYSETKRNPLILPVVVEV
jgi:ribonuclease J